MRTTAKTLAAAAALLLPFAAAALLPSPAAAAAAAAAGALLQPPARRRDNGGNNRRPWRPQQQQAQQQAQQQQQHTQTQVLFAGKSAGALPAASVSERGGRGDPRPPVPLPRKGPAPGSSLSSRFAAAAAGGSAAGWGGAFFWAAAAASAASSDPPDEYVYGAVDAPIGLAFGAGVLAIATAALPVLLRSGEKAFEEIRERDEGTFGADTSDVLKSKKGGRK
jgi:hypothetical protein